MPVTVASEQIKAFEKNLTRAMQDFSEASNTSLRNRKDDLS